MKLAVEKSESIIGSEQVHELLAAHWKEVAQYKHIMQLEPEFEKYRKLEENECLHVVVARDDDGKVVGYSVHFIVRGHPHYRRLTAAEDNIFYLVPALRGTGAHVEMRRFALRTLKDRGVQFVTARVKVDHPHDNSLRRIGFKPFDLVYGLDLTTWE